MPPGRFGKDTLAAAYIYHSLCAIPGDLFNDPMGQIYFGLAVLFVCLYPHL
jgi:hypothetical protein